MATKKSAVKKAVTSYKSKDRVARAADIVARQKKGQTLDVIAAAHKLSTGRVRTILKGVI
jgi:predicted transcriptional regulator